MTAEPTSDTEPTVFVQLARRLSFSGRSITLIDLAPATVFLTGPNRSVGCLTTGMFLDLWYAEASGSRTRGVDGVLSLLDADRAQGSDARLTLSLPRISGTGVEYQVNGLVGDIPGTSGACVLFISPHALPLTPAGSTRPPVSRAAST